MRRITRAFAAASLVLLGAAAAPAGALEAGAACLICTAEAVPLEATPASPVTHQLSATFSMRVGELRESNTRNALFAFDPSAGTFELALDEDLVLSGHLAPKGKSGRKLTLFFDEGSHQKFLRLVVSRGKVLASVFSLDVLGDTTKVVLQLDDEGVPSLKLKSRVLTSGPLEFVVKLKLVPSDER